MPASYLGSPCSINVSGTGMICLLHHQPTYLCWFTTAPPPPPTLFLSQVLLSLQQDGQVSIVQYCLLLKLSLASLSSSAHCLISSDQVQTTKLCQKAMYGPPPHPKSSTKQYENALEPNRALPNMYRCKVKRILVCSDARRQIFKNFYPAHTTAWKYSADSKQRVKPGDNVHCAGIVVRTVLHTARHRPVGHALAVLFM